MEIYPNEFVNEVINEYGKESDTAEAALLGSYNLGNLLNQGVITDFPPSEIVQLLEEGKPDEVIQRAKSCINRKKLHKMWLSIMMNRIKKIEQEEKQKSFSFNEVPLPRRNVSANPTFLSSRV